MKHNIGTMDKIIRGALGLFFMYIAAMNYGTAMTLSIIAFVIGFLLLLTSMFRFCFLYSLLGISTLHEKKPNT